MSALFPQLRRWPCFSLWTPIGWRSPRIQPIGAAFDKRRSICVPTLERNLLTESVWSRKSQSSVEGNALKPIVWRSTIIPRSVLGSWRPRVPCNSPLVWALEVQTIHMELIRAQEPSRELMELREPPGLRSSTTNLSSTSSRRSHTCLCSGRSQCRCPTTRTIAILVSVSGYSTEVLLSDLCGIIQTLKQEISLVTCW